MFVRSYRRRSSSRSGFQSPAPRRINRSRDYSPQKPHQQSSDNRSLDTRRRDGKQSSSKDTVHSRRWVIGTALILSLSSWLNVCQYSSLQCTGTSEKIAKGLLAPWFSCRKIYLICWKKFMFANAKYTVSGKNTTIFLPPTLPKAVQYYKKLFRWPTGRKFLPRW